MADWGAALIALTLDGEGVTALVGEQVDWTVRPAIRDLPGLVFETITDDRTDHFSGAQGLRMTRVQADAYSAVSAQEATAVAEALIAWLRPDPGTLGSDVTGARVKDGIRFDRMGAEGPVDSGDQLDTVYVHRARVDLLVWHAEIEEEL